MKQRDLGANAFLLVGLLGVCSTTWSQTDPKFVPYIETGVVDYSLSFKGNVPLPDSSFYRANNTFYFDFMSAKLGLAAIYGDFSANIYYLTTNKDSDDQNFPGLEQIPTITWEGDRSAFSGTIAYTVFEGASVFGGYRDSETKGSGSYNSDYKFKHDGFFAGASYQLPVTDTGGLTFALGYAWLDMSLDEVLLGADVPSADGDGSGAKLGLTWRDFLNKNLGYTISIEYFKYEYDLNIEGGSGSPNMEEEESTVSIGLFYVF
ncbi:MAG: hypothetical protein KC592_11190 [Nitrospira sp.]|nr:hypothetical protein [Nitrospira sp.]